MSQLGQKFAHVATAYLPWHMQNVIRSLFFVYFFTTFQYQSVFEVGIGLQFRIRCRNI